MVRMEPRMYFHINDLPDQFCYKRRDMADKRGFPESHRSDHQLLHLLGTKPSMEQNHLLNVHNDEIIMNIGILSSTR